MTVANRRLAAQHVGTNKPANAADVVHRLLAVQAQDFAGAKWALGIRMREASEHAIEKAFADGAILRTHVLRPTWHFVTPPDIRWLLQLTAPRIHALGAPYYRKAGLDSKLLARCGNMLGRALEGGKHLTRDELRRILAQNGIDSTGDLRMSYLLMHAELEGIVCSGPRHGKQFTYALLDERVPESTTSVRTRQESLSELARRYFLSRGPATVHDCAKWSGLTIADVRLGLNGVKHELQCETLDGREHFGPTNVSFVPTRTHAAHLISIYDELVSSYKDRSAFVNASDGARLLAMGNALSGIIVLDGQIVGTWKRVLKKDTVAVLIDTFQALSQPGNRAVTKATTNYASFLNLQLVSAKAAS